MWMAESLGEFGRFRVRARADGQSVQFFGRDGPWPSIIECCAGEWPLFQSSDVFGDCI